MAYTSFFRDPDALEGIRTLVVPALSHRAAIRVWDAGCATGEEPYTIAMVFASLLGPFTFGNLDILATDQEESSFPQFEQRIKQGTYSRQDIFWVPAGMRERYFQETGETDQFRVVPELRNKVRFLKHDLLSLQAPESGFSLIVCKNVLMHFQPDERLRVLDMFHAALIPDGFLAMDGFQSLPPEFSTRFSRPDPGLPLYRKSGA